MEHTNTVLTNKVLEELIEHYPNLKRKEIVEIVREYYRTLFKLVTYGNKVNDETYVKRIKIPYMGFIVYTPHVLRRFEEGKEDFDIDREDFAKLYTYIYVLGWSLLRWSKNKGYEFHNSITGEDYYVKLEYIKGLKAAVLYLYNKLTDDDKSNIIIELNYSGKIYKCDLKRNVVEVFENYEDLEFKNPINFIDIFRTVIHNSKKRADSASKLIGRYVYVKECDYNKPESIKTPHAVIKHDYKIDIVDKDTGEILYKEYGNPIDCVQFIKLLGKYVKPTQSNIIRYLDTDNTIYGYKWKKS